MQVRARNDSIWLLELHKSCRQAGSGVCDRSTFDAMRTMAVSFVLVLALAACGQTDSPPEAAVATSAPAASTTQTTAPSAAAVALDAAREACEIGDVSTRTGIDTLRTALATAGRPTTDLTDDQVLQAWSAYEGDVGVEAADEANYLAEVADYGSATELAAKAAALDARWDSLHRSFSGYSDYLSAAVSSATSEQVDVWFTEITVGCERVRALSDLDGDEATVETDAPVQVPSVAEAQAEADRVAAEQARAQAEADAAAAAQQAEAAAQARIDQTLANGRVQLTDSVQESCRGQLGRGCSAAEASLAVEQTIDDVMLQSRTACSNMTGYPCSAVELEPFVQRAFE